MTGKIEIDERAGIRSEIYHYLSIAFSKPDESFGDYFAGLTPLLDDLYPESSGYFEDVMKSLLLQIENIESLQCDYGALFIGPFQTLAPPYASVYLNEGIIMGDSTIQVMECYSAVGLEVNQEEGLIPDHISIELEFIHHCLLKYMESGDTSYYDLHTAFITEHMYKWIPDFISRILSSDVTGYYRDLAKFFAVFFEKDFYQASHLPVPH
jgi:TorA maturation chaperone TorD